jgi:hypothetical protein
MQCYLERSPPAKANALASQLHDRPALSLWHRCRAFLNRATTWKDWIQLAGGTGRLGNGAN